MLLLCLLFSFSVSISLCIELYSNTLTLNTVALLRFGRNHKLLYRRCPCFSKHNLCACELEFCKPHSMTFGVDVCTLSPMYTCVYACLWRPINREWWDMIEYSKVNEKKNTHTTRYTQQNNVEWIDMQYNLTVIIFFRNPGLLLKISIIWHWC